MIRLCYDVANIFSFLWVCFVKKICKQGTLKEGWIKSKGKQLEVRSVNRKNWCRINFYNIHFLIITVTYTLQNLEVAVKHKEERKNSSFYHYPEIATFPPVFQCFSVHSIFILYTYTQYAVLLLSFWLRKFSINFILSPIVMFNLGSVL